MRTIEKLRKALSTQFLTETEIAVILGRVGLTSKIARMINAKELIRLKRGFFVFGDDYRSEPVEIFNIANLLHGPSYVSLESALSYYGMIPEHPKTTVSINTKSVKRYNTPIGDFIYRVIRQESFNVGVKSVLVGSSNCLIATKEKAILDKLYLDGGNYEPYDYLEQSLRIEESSLVSLDLKWTANYAKVYGTKKFMNRINSLLERLRRISGHER